MWQMMPHTSQDSGTKKKRHCSSFPVAEHNNNVQQLWWISDGSKFWSYSLLCDKHLNHKDAEEDEGGTANIVFEHWQIQGSVLRGQETEDTWTTCLTLGYLNSDVKNNFNLQHVLN